MLKPDINGEMYTEREEIKPKKIRRQKRWRSPPQQTICQWFSQEFSSSLAGPFVRISS